MANTGAIYCGMFGVGNVDALREFGLRGFDYVPWTGHADMAAYTAYHTRSLTEIFSMFIDTANVSLVRTSYKEMLNKFGVMEVEWCLGGSLDRASPAFVYPRVNVIEPFVSAYFDSTDCELTAMSSGYLSWVRFEGSFRSEAR